MEVETLIESGYCYSSNDLISVTFNNASAITALISPVWLNTHRTPPAQLSTETVRQKTYPFPKPAAYTGELELKY